ncbi:MAG: hypothetical protein DI533_07855 [Cereibacter sphaeroides]|uniref:Uncharacterized protein n=1 Tax=Cereibacter sphaeroides TaxID=1063 RepID=A0A2W5UAS5_CERSP|nr:MAG: hypothetical protein DI533_07855 [Cereibacter sphaeroides]
MGHDWIFDVLNDLRQYAQKNGLSKLAAQVEIALQVAEEEIAAAERDPDENDEDVPPPGRRH